MPAFVKTPVEHATAWYKLRYFDRALGADLFRVFGNDEVLDVAIEELPDVACRILAVEGRERPTVKRALGRIIDSGLIIEDGSSTRLLYSRESFKKHCKSSNQRPANRRPMTGERPVNGQSTTSQRSVNDQPTVSERPVNGQSMVSQPPVNGGSTEYKPPESLKIGSVDRERDREREKEEKRSEKIKIQPWEVEGYETAYAWLNSKLRTWKFEKDGSGMFPPQNESWAKAVTALAGSLEKAKDPQGTLARLLAGFERDAKARSEGYPVQWLANNPSQYVAPKSAPKPDASQLPAHYREQYRRDAEAKARAAKSAGGRPS